MLTDVIREAFRQCRRRPLAVVLAVVIAGLEVLVNFALLRAPDGVRVLALLALLATIFLFSLFVIAFLADGLLDQPPGARAAWETARRAIPTGLRATLLTVAYAMTALMVATMFAGISPEDDPDAQISRLLLGSVPLVAFAIAFLTVALQRVVLDGERRALIAAAFSHKVAVAHFPVCFVIGLLYSGQLAIAGRDLSVAALVAATLASGLLRAWVPAMSNALYLRTRGTISLERRT